MKKLLTLVIFLALMVMLSIASASSFSFRQGIRWYMSKEQVILCLKKEGTSYSKYKITDENDKDIMDAFASVASDEYTRSLLWAIVVKNVTIDKASDSIVMVLTGTKIHGLISAIYSIAPKNTSIQGYYERAKEIKGQLEKEYGSVTVEDYFKGVKDISAVPIGYIYTCKKKLGDNTEIELNLRKTGQNQYSLTLSYDCNQSDSIDQAIIDGTYGISLKDSSNQSTNDIALILDKKEITINKGQSEKLSFDIQNNSENLKIKKTTWTSSDNKIATVQNGTVKGVGRGIVSINCLVVLSDGTELSQTCYVCVKVLASSISVSPKSITIGKGNTKQVQTEIKPDNVNGSRLEYVSDNPDIVKVNSEGLIEAVGLGTATVTISTTDGSNKSCAVSVYVPSISPPKKEYIMSKKSGNMIKLKYYGTKDNLNLSGSGQVATYSYTLSKDEIQIYISPIKAGSFSMTISDKSDPKSKYTFKVTIDHNAVYDNVSYPKIQYKEVARYPQKYKNHNCSFSGSVLQIMDDGDNYVMRVSSKGNYDDVVYVTIQKRNVTIPILEDDHVTVYGKLDGNYTYTSIFGQQVTLPSVIAERIDVK